MMSSLLLLLIAGDFQISTEIQDQFYPVVTFAYDKYYVFWYDMRFYSPDRSIFAARVATNGTLLDPAGKLILRDRTVRVDVAHDGVNFLAVIQDSC